MASIHQNGVFDKLPVAELATALQQFLKPVAKMYNVRAVITST